MQRPLVGGVGNEIACCVAAGDRVGKKRIIAAHHRDGGAGTGQRGRNSPADAAPAAGDYRMVSVQDRHRGRAASLPTQPICRLVLNF
jgi:hypothetical protein